MNRYVEYKKRKQAEFDKLPMKAAFGNKQFEQIMKEWGLTTSKEDLTKIHQLGAGCYCLKKDYPLFLKLACKHMEEDVEFFKDDDNLKSAFKYEFADHECGYTYTPQDALLALPFTYKEVMTNKRLCRVFKKAWTEYIRDYNKINKNIRDIL